MRPSKEDYIKERNRIVRQYLRTKHRLHEFTARYKTLSPSGHEELGSLKAQLSTTENLLDAMDLLFDVPFSKELIIMEKDDSTVD